MKNLKLNDLDVQELDIVEMYKIEGGATLTDVLSGIGTQFISIREKLDAETKKMGEEISNFRNELMNGVRSLL